MTSSGSPELSVVLPFVDHEEVLGDACRRLANHLRALGLSFEILAVDEGSGDNTHALLALLRGELPELELIVGGPHRGYSTGATHARGRTLLLIEPAAAVSSLAPLAGALERVSRGVDVVLLPGRFVAAKRTRALAVLDPLRARGPGFARHLARRCVRRGLTVETWPVGDRGLGRERMWDRFVGVLTASMAR